MGWIRQNLSGFWVNIIAGVVLAMVAGPVAVIWAVIEGVPHSYLIPLFFITVGAIFWSINQTLTFWAHRPRNPDEKTVREWFYRRGFSVQDAPNPNARFAFTVIDHNEKRLVVAKDREDSYFLILQATVPIAVKDWGQFQEGTQQILMEILTLFLIQMGLGSSREVGGQIVIEARVASDDPLCEWSLLERAMRVRQAIGAMHILGSQVLRERRLSEPSVATQTQPSNQ
jgi:hypothetical protein